MLALATGGDDARLRDAILGYVQTHDRLPEEEFRVVAGPAPKPASMPVAAVQ